METVLTIGLTMGKEESSWSGNAELPTNKQVHGTMVNK